MGIEDGAMALQRKMTQASDLIGGLAGERIRWTEDSHTFESLKERLVGDCAVACAFVSYCGPFNQDFRAYMVNQKFYVDCVQRGVPATKNIDIIPFLVDAGTIGDGNQQGLPTDELSIQNGILTTSSTRYPLMIDPQAQAITWPRSAARTCCRTSARRRLITQRSRTNSSSRCLKVWHWLLPVSSRRSTPCSTL